MQTFIRHLVLAVTCFTTLVIAQPASPIQLSHKGNVTALQLDSSGTIHATLVADSSWYLILKSDGSLYSKDLIATTTLTELDFGVGKSATLFSWRFLGMFLNSYIYAMSRRSDSGALPSAVVVNDPYADAQRYGPTVVSTGDTTCFVAWSGNGQQTPMAHGVYGQFVSNSLNRIGPNILMSDDTLATRDNFTPRVAVSPSNGRMAVVWMRLNNWGNSMVVRVFSPSGVPLGLSVSVSTDTSRRYLWGHSIAAHPDGGFIVAWGARVNDTLCNVFVRRFDSMGSPTGPEMIVNTQSAEAYSEAEIAVDVSGNAFVAWESLTEPQRIYAQRFAGSGQFMGDNFELSKSSDTLRHFYPQVAIRNDTIYAIWNTPTGPSLRIVPFNNVPVRVEVPPQRSQDEVSLTVHPNPFNSSTVVVLDLKRAGSYSVQVIDILGRRVAILNDSFLHPGRHSFAWDASPFSSGLFFVRVMSGDFILTHRLLLLK